MISRFLLPSQLVLLTPGFGKRENSIIWNIEREIRSKCRWGVGNFFEEANTTKQISLEQPFSEKACDQCNCPFQKCPLYCGLFLQRNDFWDENICPLFGGVRCIEISVDGDFTALFFRGFVQGPFSLTQHKNNYSSLLLKIRAPSFSAFPKELSSPPNESYTAVY